MRTTALPLPVADTLRSLAGALGEILRSNLVAVYVYGSLTQRAFDPARSDIDCLVVVHRDLTKLQVQKLRAWLYSAAKESAWIPRLQMQILRLGRLLRTDTRGFLYQFGALKRSGSDGNPLVWLNVLATGITLAGPTADSILPPITDAMIHEALVREVNYLRVEIMSPAGKWRGQAFYRTYAVLTLCRILYSHRKGTVVSKPRAARWALRVLARSWHSLIREAVASNRGKPAPLRLPRIARFIEFTERQLGEPAGKTFRTMSI